MQLLQQVEYIQVHEQPMFQQLPSQQSIIAVPQYQFQDQSFSGAKPNSSPHTSCSDPTSPGPYSSASYSGRSSASACSTACSCSKPRACDAGAASSSASTSGARRAQASASSNLPICGWMDDNLKKAVDSAGKFNMPWWSPSMADISQRA